MADYLEDIVQNIYTKCDLTDFNLLIHATDELAKKANKLGRAFNKALTGEQQVALAKSNEIISHNVARQKEATVALAEHNKEISWNKVLLAEQNRLKAENNNATKIATQDRDRQISQDRLQNQLSKERTAQIKKETDAMRRQSNIMRSLGRLFVTYFGISTIRGIIETGSRLQLVQKSIEGLTKSTQDWVFVEQQAYQMGVSLETVAKGYRNFYSAANMAGFDKGNIQGMYADLLLATRSIGASTQQTEGALLALEQMISKGKVSMEELRRQLGNAIPGAFEIGAKAMNMTTAQFNDFVRTGELASAEFVPKFIKTLKETYAGGWQDIEQTVSVAQGRLKVAWEKFTINFMSGEAGRAFAQGLNTLAELLNSNEFKELVRILSVIFSWAMKIFQIVMKLVNFLLGNLPLLLTLLGGAGLYGLMAKFPIILKLMNKEALNGVKLMTLLGVRGVKSFFAMNAAALKFGATMLGILSWILIIQDVLLYLIGLATGEEIDTMTGAIVGEIPGGLDSLKALAVDMPKQTQNMKDLDRITDKKLRHKIKMARINGDFNLERKLWQQAKEGGAIGYAAPISGTYEPYTPPDIIPSGLPMGGASAYSGMLNKEQEVTTSVNIGDINVYSNASNPQQVAQEVQEQLIALFMGQGLITDVEGYA